jgi:tetratricopeptide (TPR) repeat protein
MATLRLASVPRVSSVPSGPPVLTPAAQKELAKAAEALRAKNLKQAQEHLSAAYRLIPNNPEVNYLFGFYYAQTDDWTRAKLFWEKTLSFAPGHSRALLALGEAMVRERRFADAIPYLTRLVETAPTAWQPHAILAEVYLHQNLLPESIQQAQRALELGHDAAINVQSVLVRALVLHGERQRAVQILQIQVQSHPDDLRSKKLLEALQKSETTRPAEDPAPDSADFLADLPQSPSSAVTVATHWLPPDVDFEMPAVQNDRPCDLAEVLRETGVRQHEFVANVEKHTATESLVHDSVDKRGLVSSSQTMKFNYLASVEEIRAGNFSVEEFREGRRGVSVFPGQIVTTGLPALVLIFHPYYAGDFAMTCEGLTRRNDRAVWQVYFRQRTDKPNRMRYYTVGARGQPHSVPMKGRAWIDAATFHVVKMDASMIAPMPEIRLLADHMIVEYAPVQFQKTHQEMWLPKTADYYYDWKGKRGHWRHSFDQCLLFTIDDKQRIAAPKDADLTKPERTVPPPPSGQ